MVNHDSIRQRFARGLTQSLMGKFGKVPSTSQVAEMFNARTSAANQITRETARKWMKGLAYPEVARLHVLIEWLGVSPISLPPLDELAHDMSRSVDLSTIPTAGESEQLTLRLVKLTLDALSAHIAVVDSFGVIRQVNRSWTDFARKNDAPVSVQDGIGLNYLSVCVREKSKNTSPITDMGLGLKAVLNGSLSEFSLKYTCHSATEKKWFVARVTGFEHEEHRYAVVSHESVSEENWHRLDYPQSVDP